MNGTNNTLLQSYVWGLDLSGTQTGAGVVGELVMMTIHTGTNAGTYLPAYDGNGNVSALVNASNGEVSANYEYGPYGEPIRVSGVISRENPYRFSTKRTVDSIDIILYEYRAYSPSLGRWLSRDLIGENGGVNLYGFVGGDAIDNFDAFGLWWSGPSFLSDHSKMTETSFNSAIAQFSLLTTQCRQNMLKILKRLTTNRILGLIPNN